MTDEERSHKLRWASSTASRFRQAAADLAIPAPPDAPFAVDEARARLSEAATHYADAVEEYRRGLDV